MSIIIVKEFAKKGVENLGLETENKSRFHGAKTGYIVPKINGSYVLPTMDKTQKEFIEKSLNFKFGSDSANEFLSSFVIEINSDLIALDTTKPIDLLTYLYISQIFKYDFANSKEEAEDPQLKQRFLIVKDQEDIKATVSRKTILNKAIAALQKLSEQDVDKLIRIAKYLLPSNLGISLNATTAYDALDSFIKGEMAGFVDPDKLFLQALNEKSEIIEVTSIVKEALLKQVIRKNHKHEFFNVMDQTFLGTTEDSVVQFLLNPENGDILGYGLESDRPSSIRYQIKIKQ